MPQHNCFRFLLLDRATLISEKLIAQLELRPVGGNNGHIHPNSLNIVVSVRHVSEFLLVTNHTIGMSLFDYLKSIESP